MIDVGNGAQVQKTRLEKGNVPVQGKFTVFSLY